MNFFVAKTSFDELKGCLLSLLHGNQVLAYRLAGGVPPENLRVILSNPRYNLVGMTAEAHKVALIAAHTQHQK